MDYPEFSNWFDTHYSFLKDDRKIILLLSDGKLSGVSLIKNTTNYFKICSFYILEKYRKNGLSSFLMNYIVNNFNEKDLLISVTNKNYFKYNKIFNSFNFLRIEVKNKKDIYF